MDNSMDWVAEDVIKWLEDTSVLDSKCTSISTGGYFAINTLKNMCEFL